MTAAGADGPSPDGSLRIALLSYRGNPFCGGQGVYVRHLSRELARLGHRVEVIGAQPYPVLDTEIGANPGTDLGTDLDTGTAAPTARPGVPEDGGSVGSVTLTELPSLDLYRDPDPFRTPRPSEFRDWIDALEVGTMWTGGFPEPLTFSLRARRHLAARRGDFDVVHDNQTLGYGMLGIERLGLPLVTTIHHPITVDRRLELGAAPSVWRRASVLRWYGFTRMQQRVARRMPSVLTVSRSSRREILEDLGVRPERVQVVPIGADTRVFHPNPAAPVVPGRIVTTSSADAPLKGLVHLVEALAAVRRDHPGAHVVVVGTRPEQGPVARALRESGLGHAVEFVKGISDEELADLVRSAEIACVPSLYEGFSLPAAEAMATGTPLVATTGGALPEVAGPDGETCLAVPPGDSGALAAALKRLLADPGLRERLGAAGRERVLGRFTWEQAARSTAEQYRAALARRRAGTGAAAGPNGVPAAIPHAAAQAVLPAVATESSGDSAPIAANAMTWPTMADAADAAGTTQLRGASAPAGEADPASSRTIGTALPESSGTPFPTVAPPRPAAPQN